jgi:hypothetical protein
VRGDDDALGVEERGENGGEHVAGHVIGAKHCTTGGPSEGSTPSGCTEGTGSRADPLAVIHNSPQ